MPLPELGAILLRPHDDAEWAENVALFKRMRGSIAKVHIPSGFGTSPQDVEDLIQAGATTIIYRTEDRIISAEAVERDLIDRGFWDLIQRHSDLEHWCEVGNEVEHTGLDHWVYRWLLLDTVKKLKPRFPGLRWMASMPTRLDHTVDVLAGDEHGRVEDLYDALALHTYGHERIEDGGSGEWLAIYQYLLNTTSLPLVLSEFGINSPDVPKAEKGRRYLTWLSQQPERLIGATVFVIGKWEHDRYRVDATMADVLGSRAQQQPEPEPEPQPEGRMTINDAFKRDASISADGFVAILERTGSFNSDALWQPTPHSERPWEARRIYSLIDARGHDPAIWLALLGKESSFGVNQQSVLWRGDTRSWTNARSVRDPSLVGWSTYRDPERNSSYAKYRSVFDSVQDGIYRVDDPTYAYAGKRSILEIIEVWAPESDSNDPREYAQQMVEWMDDWQHEFPVEQEQPLTAQIPGFLSKPARSDHYRKGRGRKISGGAQHYTGGTNSLDWLTWSSPDPVSATFLVRRHATLDFRGWQLVRIEDTPWTTYPVNDITVSIEYEHLASQDIPDGDYEVLAQTWVDIIRYLDANSHLGGITADRKGIKGHREWNPNIGTVCPNGIDVDRIVARVREILDGAPAAPEPPVERTFPGTDYIIGGGFRAYFEWLEQEIGPNEAVLITGLALGNEYTDPVDGLTKQDFERLQMQHHPGKRPDRWDVLFNLANSDRMKALERIKELEAA